MTMLQTSSQSGDGHAGKGRCKFGDADEAVRHTDAWEHETFAEEQARWERSDPEYARICEEVRQARNNGEKASRRADQAKAEWDARAAPHRKANDDAERAHHALKADQAARRRLATSRTPSQRWKSRSLKSTRTLRLVIRAREGHHHIHTTFAIESNESPAGIMPEPVRVHDEPGATTAASGRPHDSIFVARHPDER